MPPHTKPTLIVLGSGFGGFSLLKRIDTHLYNVIAVSSRNHFLFTPLLPSTTVGTIEFRSIIEPIRVACPAATFYQAEALSVDPGQRVVECEGSLDGKRFTLSYDLLVIAVGALSNTFNIPGVEKYALFLKEVADARSIRQRIIECFERASNPAISEEELRRLLHFVVVGGGPTGVEFAAELHDLLEDDLRKAYPRIASDVRITLLEAAEHILNTFDKELSAYTRKLFQRQRIDVRTGSFVVRVEEAKIILQDGTEIPYGLVVWSTGIGPTKFILSLPFAKDRGRLIVDPFLRVKGWTNVYALGDCAVVEGNELPATSQVAQQQGMYLAKELNRLGRGVSPRPFRHHHYGMLAYVGSGRALADLAKFKGKGFVTWIFWRSAYLTKLVSWKNKTLVVFDWVKAFVFGRDVSRF